MNAVFIASVAIFTSWLIPVQGQPPAVSHEDQKSVRNYRSQKEVIPSFERWLYVGVSGTAMYNFTSINSNVTIPSSGNTQFVPVPGESLSLRIRRNFSSQWAGILGVGYSDFGVRIRTEYDDGNKGSFFKGPSRGQASLSMQQIQFASFIQYYPFKTKDSVWLNGDQPENKPLQTLRPYVRIGLLTNINPIERPYAIVFNSSRKINDKPTYRDRVEVAWKPWIKTGATAGLGITWQISGYLIDLAGVYYLGFSDLTEMSYTVAVDSQSTPSETLLESTLHNKGSFVGIDVDIYLRPFGYKKLKLNH